MDNNYYTPSIEDIRVGYTFQYRPENSGSVYGNGTQFGGTILLTEHGSLDFWIDELKLNPTRFAVPYLTKEQIESEGWEFFAERFSMYFRKGIYRLYFLIGTVEDGKGKHVHTNLLINRAEKEEFLYCGNCPSINELRYITKLLGI